MVGYDGSAGVGAGTDELVSPVAPNGKSAKENGKNKKVRVKGARRFGARRLS